MPPDPKKPPQPTRFGQPEEKDWKKIALMITLIVLAGLGITWMVKQSPKEPTLSCTSGGNGLWSAFGRCREE